MGEVGSLAADFELGRERLRPVGVAGLEVVLRLTDEQVNEIARRVAEVRPPATRPRLLDVPKAAVYLGVTDNAIREYVRYDKIPVVRANGRVLFDVLDLDQWIQHHKCKGA